GPSVELMVVGKISDSQRAAVEARAPIRLNFTGAVARTRIPELDRSAHVLFSSDLNAACPNSVIEALACGLPVVAFDTGALKELVLEGSGRLVPYGGNPWTLDAPDIGALAGAARDILNHQYQFRQAARSTAEKHLDLDIMTAMYLQFMLEA